MAQVDRGGLPWSLRAHIILWLSAASLLTLHTSQELPAKHKIIPPDQLWTFQPVRPAEFASCSANMIPRFISFHLIAVRQGVWRMPFPRSRTTSSSSVRVLVYDHIRYATTKLCLLGVEFGEDALLGKRPPAKLFGPSWRPVVMEAVRSLIERERMFSPAIETFQVLAFILSACFHLPPSCPSLWCTSHRSSLCHLSRQASCKDERRMKDYHELKASLP